MAETAGFGPIPQPSNIARIAFFDIVDFVLLLQIYEMEKHW
jgi:hypothetical protein